MAGTLTAKIKLRKDTAANWTAANPVLSEGEIGLEKNGGIFTQFKVGDGSTAWNSLSYFIISTNGTLNQVLTAGNTTSGRDIIISDDDIIQIGSTANRYIGYSTSTIAGGLEIVNLNSNDHIILQDAGGIHIDTSYIQLPQYTASRVLTINAANQIDTSTVTVLELSRLSGVTSSVQAQLNARELLTNKGIAGGYCPLDGSVKIALSYLPTMSSSDLAGIISDETGTGALVFGTAPTLKNPIIGDTADSTKSIAFTLSGATTAKALTLVSAHTDNRTLTFPDETGTLVTKGNMTFRAYNSGGQTITKSTNTKMTFDVENFDEGSCFSGSTFTPNKAGKYRISSAVWWNNTYGVTMTLRIYIYKNGAEYSRTDIGKTYTASGTYTMQINDIVDMNGSTDYIEIYVFQSHPTNSMTISAGTNLTWFAGELIN